MRMNNDLRELIEQLRKKMVTVGMTEGFTSEETIKLSKRLDYLINLQMKKVPA
jgi:hypothetical protein